MEEEKKEAMVVPSENTRTPMLQDYADNWKVAQQYAKSDLLPDNYKAKPENVIIALGMSQQLDLPIFTVMQNLNIVRGRASWSGSFCRTLIEKTGKYSDLDLVYIGEEGKDTWGCYLKAIRKKDGKEIKGTKVTVAMAKSEGWWSKKDKYGNETSKWQSMTELMLGYRAMSFFARMHCPEALSGIYTGEEVEDMNNNNTVVEVNDILGD